MYGRQITFLILVIYTIENDRKLWEQAQILPVVNYKGFYGFIIEKHHNL